MERSMKDPVVLVAGGYGEVGQRVSTRLAQSYPGGVIAAGRSLDRASRAAEAIGSGVHARALDANDASSIARVLDGVTLVVSCVDQREPFPLLSAAVSHGLAYTDL